MRKSLSVGLLLTWLTIFIAAADQSADERPLFRWLEQGQLTYGDAPPVGVDAQRLDYGDAQVLQRWTPQTGDSSGRPPVYLLTSAECLDCDRLRALLNRRRIPFQEYDVQHSVVGRRELLRLGSAQVPQVLVSDTGNSGYDEVRVNELLDAAGY
jgi:glutaredoxin